MLSADYSHEQLMEQFKKFGYTLNLTGVCAGLAQMAIQAFLAGDEEFKRFNKRLTLLATEPNIIDRVNQVKKNIAERSKKLKKKLNIIIEPDEQELLDIIAFFDTLEIYHQPFDHSDVFNKFVSQPEIAALIPYAASALLSIKGIQVVDSFQSIYSRMELENYLNKLDDLVRHHYPPTDFVMDLDSGAHRISLCFNREKSTWILIDANKLPPTEIATTHLTETLFDCLVLDKKTKTFVAFNTNVYSTNEKNFANIELLKKLKKTREFHDSHNITPERISREMPTLKMPLNYLSIRFNNEENIKKILAINPDSFFLDSEKESIFNNIIEMNRLTLLKLFAKQPNFWLKMKDTNLLGFAAKKGRIEIVEYLLSIIPSAELPHSLSPTNADSPLIFAIKHNQTKVTQLLLKQGVDLLKKPIRGIFPIQGAVRVGSFDIVQLFIKEDKNEINILDKNKQSLAAIAANQNQLNILQFLLNQAPHQLNQTNINNETPLMLAAKNGHVQIVEELLKRGADFNKEDKFGLTAIHVAAKNNKTDILKIFDQYGINIEQESNKTGRTPIDEVKNNSTKHFFEAVQLRKKMLDVITKLKTKFIDNYAYLHAFAVFEHQLIEESRNHYEEFLLKYESLSPETAIVFIAVEKNNVEALFALRECGMPFTNRNHQGDLPIHVAIRNGLEEMTVALIDNEASLSATTPDVFNVTLSATKPSEEDAKNLKENNVLLYVDKNQFHFLGKDFTGKIIEDRFITFGDAAKKMVDDLKSLFLINPLPAIPNDLQAFILNQLKLILDLNRNYIGFGDLEDEDIDASSLIIKYGKPEILKKLLEKYPTKLDIQLLFKKAIFKNDPNIINLLIESKIDLNQKINGDLLLCIAANDLFFGTFKTLLENGANLTEVNRQGLTPIQNAIKNNAFNILKLLDRKGVKFTASMVNKLSPALLSDLSKTKFLEFIKSIGIRNSCLEKLEEINSIIKFPALEQFKETIYNQFQEDHVFFIKNRNKNPVAMLLLLAIKNNDKSAFSALCASGADLNYAITMEGHTPATYAAANGKIDILHLLSINNIDFEIKDLEPVGGKKVSDFAETQPEVKQFLLRLEKQAIISEKLAALISEFKITSPEHKVLLDLKDHLQMEFKNNFHAISERFKKVLPDDALSAIAFYAAEKEDAKALNAILQSREGASWDINLRNLAGLSLAHIAGMQGNDKIMTLLREKKADLNLDTLPPTDTTPILFAAQRGHWDLVMKLLTFERSSEKMLDALKKIAVIANNKHKIDILKKIQTMELKLIFSTKKIGSQLGQGLISQISDDKPTENKINSKLK